MTRRESPQRSREQPIGDGAEHSSSRSRGEWTAKTQHAAYRFLDAAFVLETDSPAFLEHFDAAYARFRIPAAGDDPVYRVTLGGDPSATIAGRTVRSSDAGALGDYAYNAILNAATARVRSHFLFHAAALQAPGNRGTILAGGGGLGKTTLTLALMARGFGFLSDDVAPVGRADAMVYRFPRRIGVRVAGGRPGEKALRDVSDVARPCPAEFLFVLHDPAGHRDGDSWYILLDRLDDRLLADLRSEQGVQGAQVVRGAPYPAVRLMLMPGSVHAVEARIEALCDERGTLLFEMVQGREGPPDFDRAPSLAPLSTTDAARELLRYFKGGPRSRLLRELHGGSAARLLLDLADLTARMRCYRLAVGRLEPAVDLIVAATATQV